MLILYTSFKMVYKLFVFAVTVALFSYGLGQPTLNQIIVAQDGSGNYSTINSAITAAPNNSAQKYYIRVREGVYFENIIVGEGKTNLFLLGEGIDKTIISGSRSNGSGFTTELTATVGT